METKKGVFQQSNSCSHNDESSEVENYLKHAHPQTRPADHLSRSFQLSNKSFSEESNSIHQIRSDNEYRIVQSCDNFNNVIPSPHYVQYQKQPFQNTHYHAHQTTLVPNLSHNLVVKNSPQVWIPQQHHYHLPQAQNVEYKNVSISSAQTTPSKLKDSEKKKSSGISQLKSPIAKRPLEALVTMQGWLYKQGSEGLMLWKKRWFVLSEYCLFYYKGPEEEKLLGSILLPSYKVSLCKPEEKISKKYAFKCEHLNMRTYILAADSQELMKQWVHNLSLAATMQTNVDVHRSSSYTTAAQQKPAERYEPSGQQYNKPVMRLTPISHTHSPSSSVLQDQGSFNQPLYANAPPKPRRLNDGFSSPSPDILDPHNPHYVDPRTLEKSPGPTYSTVNYKSKNPRESLMVSGGDLQGNHDFERRTPDTYGRSKLNNPHITDYEDVYATQPDIYKRPLSPVAYSHVVKRSNPAPINPAHRYYTPVEAMGPTDLVQYSIPQMRKVPNINIARPHSADFLEYELNHKMQDSSVLLKQRPRPKSSLEINSNLNDNDNYFYSKERYAEKMRRSAQYLQNTPPKYRNDMMYNTNEAPMRCSAHDTTFPFIERPHVHTHAPNINKLHINCIQKPQPVRRKSVISEGNSFKPTSDMDPGLLIEREQVSPYYMYGSNIRNQDYDSFTRSASARLAQTPTQIDRASVDNRSTDREGDKKREESMKRLLEWKQRMLQSPLNRKIQGNVAYRGKTGFYENNIYDSGYKVRRNPKRNNVYRDEMSNKSSSQYNSYSSDDEASGSISINIRDSSQLALRDSFLRVMPTKKSWATNSLPVESRSVTNLSRSIEKDQYSTSTPKAYYSNQTSSHPNLTPVGRQDNWRSNDRVSVSAGELLGRTHEELVLLLIQLRRQNAQTLQAIENYYNEVDKIQAQLCAMDQARRLENLQKLEQIRQHLLELEKQYEKGKPLVNLVDNMVKLGTLYRAPQEKSMGTPHIRDRLEFNQQIQERRLLADQKREWDRLNSNHHQFQEKVQQLYILDRLIHEESGTLQNLQQDKEDIERALVGLRHRLSKGFNDPSEVEIARKQQVMLENELSRVYFMLAQNSKKLEETVSGNAKLEQELMVLKQKLQNSRQGSPQYSNAGDSLTCTIGSNIGVESDLQKVEKKIGELQKQRQKLSLQVRQLTNRSPNASQQKQSSSSFHNSLNKKKIPSWWRETDLDTMSSIDHGECDQLNRSIPMYINTDGKLEDYDYYNHLDSSNTSVSENNSVIPQEKQEIKTVRIVKRESEKRQRDREKLIPGKWDPVQEDDGLNDIQKGHIASSIEQTDKEPNLVNTSTQSSASGSNMCDQEAEKSSDMLPVFKSEAARQIITEMSVQSPPRQPNRRAVPKEKRRHYTAPHNHSIKSLNPPDDVFDKLNVNNRRARDDLDMERALRQRIDAPDVVRSTLINTELKYNERTIDDILGIPSKINIPERYIPEQLPQLTVEEQEHRMKKVETIKKMLSDTTFISTSSTNLSGENRETKNAPSSSVGNKATTQIMDEKKQREHLLQLNQILAKQVMEMSKIVAVLVKVNATATKSSVDKTNVEEEDLSPLTPLPLYQQRDNFYS